MICWGEAWAVAGEGSAGAAVALLIDAADEIRESAMRAVEVFMLVEATRLGGAHVVEQRLGLLAEELATPAAVAAHQLALGVVSRDVDPLSRASETFADSGALLLAGEAALLAGHEHRRAGRKGKAATMANRARTLLDLCPGARPPTAAFLEGPMTDTLTRREREIAVLASRDLSSPEIATQLDLSGRTVENHLARIFVKLGIRSRSDLRTIFAEAG